MAAGRRRAGAAGVPGGLRRRVLRRVDRFTPREGAAREWARARPRRRHAATPSSPRSITTASRCGRHAAVGLLDRREPPYGGDLVREFVDAARDAGLRVGFYFSLCDWHHPDYPAFTDGAPALPTSAALPQPTRRAVGALPSRPVRPDARAADRLRPHRSAVVRRRLGARRRGRWRARTSCEAMIRELQPDILINDRLPGAGDFETPEQFVPPLPPARRWETCLTHERELGLQPDATHATSRRASSCTRSARWRGAAATCCSTSSPMADGILPADAASNASTRSPAGWRRYGDEHRRHHARARAVAVLRTDHPPRRPDLPAPADAALRHRDRARCAGAARRRRARASRPAPRSHYATRCAILDGLFNPDPFGELTIARAGSRCSTRWRR